MDDYNCGGQSKYSMKVHRIFVTKYHKKIFKSDKRTDDVKQFLRDTVTRLMASERRVSTHLKVYGFTANNL